MINTAVVYAALAAGPFLGGMLTHYPGWQSLFFVTAGVGVLVLVFARLFSFSILATLINCSATSAIAFMLSLYLQYVRGWMPAMPVFSLISGPLSDRVSPSRLATAGMILIVCGLAGLIFLNEHTPQGHLIFLPLLSGFGFGIFSSPNTNVVMGPIDKK